MDVVHLVGRHNSQQGGSMKPRPGLILWKDHVGQNEKWQEKIDFKRMVLQCNYTCAWIMEVTEDQILILGTFGEGKDDEVSGGNALDRRCIDRIVYLDTPSGWKQAKKILDGLREF